MQKTRLTILACSLAAFSATAQTVTDFAMPDLASGTFPLGICAGSDGNIWIALSADLHLARMTPAGSFTYFPIPGADAATYLTPGPDGAIWFTVVNGRLGRSTTKGEMQIFDAAGTGLLGLTAGSDGNIWMVDNGANQIVRFSVAQKAVTGRFPIPTPNSSAVSITSGPDGNLWFTEGLGNKIGRITPQGVITEFPVATASSSPGDITAGADGFLYAALSNVRKLVRISTSGAIEEIPVPASGFAFPLNGVVAGADGAIWMAAGQFLRLDTTTRKITSFPAPSGANPSVISTGPGGRDIYASMSQNRIGKVAPVGAGASGGSFFLPVALADFPGAKPGVVFSTEATLTNRSTSTALDVSVKLKSLLDGSTQQGTLTLAKGSSKTYASLLRDVIPGLPADRQAGTVFFAVKESGTTTTSDALSVVARTTTPVDDAPSSRAALSPAALLGQAGLAYLGLPESSGLTGTGWITGLRQNVNDRSNLAYLNSGTAGDVTVRITIFPADGSAPTVLPDESLAPGSFKQINGVLGTNGLSLSEGYAQVKKVGGTGRFYAYGVINDERNSDGSFVTPTTTFGTAGLTLPVAVELSTFITELMVTNTSAQARPVRVTFAPAGFSRVSTVLTLQPGQQRLIPSFVDFLRQALPAGSVPAAGPTFAGPVFVTPEGAGDVSGIVVGARTATRPGALGAFGVFTPAIPYSRAYTGSTWIYGLQQDAVTRSNVALLNTGETDASPDTFRIEIYDDRGAKVSERTDTVAAGTYFQINKILSDTTAAHGAVRITRTSGTNPYVAYGVLNDGADSGQRTGDGAYVEAVEEAAP